MMFLIDDSTELNINVIPSFQDIGIKGSKALVQMRLINQEESDFITHTLSLMIIGFVLISIFLVILMKSMDMP